MTATPLASVNVSPAFMLGSSSRTLSPSFQGRVGTNALTARITSWPGFMRTVSFQPSSLGSGGRSVPSIATRLITCTLNRWKWMAWVSTPWWSTRQIWVPSFRAPIWVAFDESRMMSVGVSS